MGNKQHERIIQKLVNNLLKDGCPPELISISSRQNRGLESWAKRKRIVFSKTQKHDITHPAKYSMETKETKVKVKVKVPKIFLDAFRKNRN